jgi:Zn-dependent M16 (insulinase) family peptidase
MLRWVVIATALSVPLGAHAAGSSESEMRGKFAFDWHTDPNKTKCARVSDKLLSMFMSAKFNCAQADNTASGIPAVACSAAGGSSEYLIFKTFAACEEERKTQVSNGD